MRRAEVDAQGIVFNAHYLMYADTAVMAYWRALGVPYASAMRRLGTELPVRKAAVEYFASARPDDRLRIGVRLVRVGRTSVTLEAVMRREHTVLARAEVVYVCVDAAHRCPRPFLSCCAACSSASSRTVPPAGSKPATGPACRPMPSPCAARSLW